MFILVILFFIYDKFNYAPVFLCYFLSIFVYYNSSFLYFLKVWGVYSDSSFLRTLPHTVCSLFWLTSSIRILFMVFWHNKHFYLIFRNASLYISVILLWNILKAECVSWLLYKIAQSTWSIKSLNLFLFLGMKILFIEYTVFCFTLILVLIMKFGKKSLMSVLNNPCIGWLISIKLSVNMLSVKFQINPFLWWV